jgi:hypothetical protein
MKPLSIQRSAHQPVMDHAKKAVKRKSLQHLKGEALHASVSSRNEPVGDVREAFGFFPQGLQGVIIHWPTL